MRTTSNLRSLKRRLHCEPLEPRQMLATFTVDTLSDVNNGNTSAGNLSIREALLAASSNSESDTIAFKNGLTGTIRLLNGSLGLSGNVLILGPGADRLTIDGNNTVRVFNVFEDGVADIRGLTIANGKTTGTDRGAGIDCRPNSTLTVRECAIVNNQTPDIGGGIHMNGPGLVTLINSTVANNVATRSGGGIGLVVGANLRLFNTTISGNTAGEAGGGVSMIGGTAEVVNSTIVRNRADANDSDPFNADKGGAFGESNVLLNNSIVAGNLRGTASPVPDELNGSTADPASSHNIIGNAATAGGLTHGTNNNLVGNSGTGTLALGAIINTTLGNFGGPTPTHNLIANGPAVDSGSNLLAVDPIGNVQTRDQRNAKRRLDGDGNGSIFADRGAVEFGIRPTLTLSGTVAYQEGNPPVIIAGAATLTDNGPSFTKLTVTNKANAAAADRLAIRNQGNGAGQIGTSGTTLSFGGSAIGNFTGGEGTIPLVFSLNANASAAAIQALIRNITFRNVSEAPATAPRTVSFVAADSDRLESQVRTCTVNVTAVNDAPVLGGIGGSTSYTQNAAAVVLASGATVTDPDSADFSGGVLLVRFTSGARAANRLTLGGAFTFSGNNIVFGGQTVATRNANGGIGTTNLRITFNENATRSIVEQLVRTVRFRTVNNDSLAQRVVEFSLTDGDGGTSALRTKTINVSA